MPNCDFYALATDCARVLDFIFDQPGWVLHELSSEDDSPVRTFHSTRTVLTTFPLCERSLHFHLYAAEMRGAILHRKITFNPGAVPGATFRYDTNGWGLIQLNLGVLRADGSLTASHTNHNSLARAQKWEPTFPDQGAVDAWDWRAVEQTSGRLVRFIRKIASSKRFLRPVLPAAHAAQAAGQATCVLHG